MENALLKIINFSSMPKAEVMHWCETVFPGKIVRLTSSHKNDFAQEEPVLVLYDGLSRRLQETVLAQEGSLETAVTEWKNEVQAVLDCVRLNVACRMCLETDATSQGNEQLRVLLGATPKQIPALRSETLEENPVAVLTSFMFQQDPDLIALTKALTEGGGACPVKPADTQVILEAMKQFAATQACSKQWQQALAERDTWLDSLRNTAWEANGRAQLAEQKLRDSSAGLQAETDRLEAETARLEAEKAHFEGQGVAWRQQVAQLTAELEESRTRLQSQISDLETGAIHSQQEVGHLKEHIDALYNSTSWRLTAPVRKLKLMFSPKEEG